MRKWKKAKVVVKRKHKLLYSTAIHFDNKGQYYFIYYPAIGGGVLNKATAFVSHHAQATADAAAAIAAGNPPSYILPVANPKVDGPNWE